MTQAPIPTLSDDIPTLSALNEEQDSTSSSTDTHQGTQTKSTTQHKTVQQSPLSEQAFHAYQQWSTQITDLLQNYASWRRDCNMDTSSVDHALTQCQPQVRLVITGEFGRGKTEFINALLTQACGERLLPVHVGRATMTPLELFYTADAAPYLKLLPIEARLDALPLDALKLDIARWEHHDINTQDPTAMRLLFQEISKTKAVTLAVAEQLGFDINFLEASSEHADHVMVPAWQHALLNIDFPVFKHGLSIIDTPGFNALGMESILSEDIIAHGQAHMHVLSIETGVTASDYQLWKNSIVPAAQTQQMPLFVLINKLDLLDHDEEPVVASLNRIKRIGAKQLDLPDTHFFALSAKFANKALLTKDLELQKRSGFDYFQSHFFNKLTHERMTLLKHGVLKPVSNDIAQKIQTHQLEIKRLEKDMAKLTTTESDVEKNYAQTKENIAKEEDRVDKQTQAFDENMRNIDLSYEHIMHIFSDKQFGTHKERGMSLFGSNSTDTSVNNDSKADEVAKARNILLAGMRLDMKRIAMDITVLNNSMRALYKDLDSQFEPREISVEFFTNYLNDIDKASIQPKNTIKDTFEHSVIRELNDTFRKQRKLINSWYASHVQTVKEPVDLAVANLEERRTLATQLAHKITERKEHLGFAQSRLPVAKEDLKRLITIKQGLDALL